ncbi:hypothetical protein VTO42DRAFT_1552 [Malbranchea cinnamomea]
MASEHAEWFAVEREKGRFETSSLEALQSYLDGSITVHDTVQQLTADSIRRPHDDHVGRVWRMFLDLAVDFQDTHESIISLLKHISELPKPEQKNKIDWSQELEEDFWHYWDAKRIWADDLLAEHNKGRDNLSDLEARRFINYHAFTATGIASGVKLNIDLGWGFVAIVAGIEKKLRPTITLSEDTRIRGAAQYFMHAARYYLDSLTNEPSYASRDYDSELWKGAPGFNLERWAFWRERWNELRQNEALSEEAREAARLAEVAMGKAERQKAKKGKKN